MRAVVLEAGGVRVAERPAPAGGDGLAVVRVSLAGICSTDLELIKGYMGFRGVLGHEFVGGVLEGPAELAGRRVVGEINFACRRCDYCRKGLGRHCPSRRVMGILRAGAVGVAGPQRRRRIPDHGASSARRGGRCPQVGSCAGGLGGPACTMRCWPLPTFEALRAAW